MYKYTFGTAVKDPLLPASYCGCNKQRFSLKGRIEFFLSPGSDNRWVLVKRQAVRCRADEGRSAGGSYKIISVLIALLKLVQWIIS